MKPKLGVDPGFSNLGLAVVDGETQAVLESRCHLIGHRKDYASWPSFVRKLIQEMQSRWGFDGIAIEAPPVFNDKPRNLETTNLLWYACGLVLGACESTAGIKVVSASVVKKHTALVQGTTWSKNSVPTKTEVRAVMQLVYPGAALRSSHEADAAMLATLAWFPQRLVAARTLWQSNPPSPETEIYAQRSGSSARSMPSARIR